MIRRITPSVIGTPMLIILVKFFPSPRIFPPMLLISATALVAALDTSIPFFLSQELNSAFVVQEVDPLLCQVMSHTNLAFSSPNSFLSWSK